MKKAKTILMLSAVVMLVAGSAPAAPGLPITKPPVQPVPSWTGPPIDPDAKQGQWFCGLDTGEETVRPYEFHDNVDPDFGGGYASHLAIRGYARNVMYNAQGNIISFAINATIENDMPARSDWWVGNNSHSEYTNPREQYVGTMYETKLTAEFAIDPSKGPGPGVSLYRDVVPHIVAVDHDQLGWYCWTPDNPEDKVPWGDYYVPTWDFGDIPMGGMASRLLQFTVDGGGLSPADLRYWAILESFEYEADLLLNRTTSLKISTWQDDLVNDTGIPYPADPLRGSDCSVFFVPEPATMSLMLLGGIGVLLRRRRK